MNQIKHILSDLDGVIRLFPSGRDHYIENKYGIPLGSINKSAFLNNLLEEVISGKIQDEHWRSDILKKLKMIVDPQVAELAFNEWNNFSGLVNHDYLDQISRYFTDLPVSILTNGTSRLNQDLEKLGLIGKFHRIFNSSEIGFFKPQEDIYLHVLKELNLNASEVLFIDDSLSHIESARKLGFTTYHYQSIAGLSDFLTHLQNESVDNNENS